jgi:penicillin-binding protein 2
VSFHPHDVARRARAAGIAATGVIVFLSAAFFRTQILRNQQWVLQSEENRLREVPLPAPRGIIYDRNNAIIAENVVGYSVSLLSQTEESLRATLRRLSGTIELTPQQIDAAARRYRRDRSRPTVIIPDASFDVISVLEEHHVDFPSLIIQSAPKRYYPEGPAVASFVGYTGEISENELASGTDSGAAYKAGQQIGKQGLEKEYERLLRGQEGSRFVEVDARNRVVREAGAREDEAPKAAPPLYTNIDLDLQKFIYGLFGDSLQGGAVAMIPRTGEVLAVYSAPSYDPNKFIGGVPFKYYDSLRNDPRRPLYNKALQGTYPPGSTWKLATSVIALETHLATMNDHMPTACTGGFVFGNRYWHCWEKKGHGSLSLAGAIAKSCDVYFYQLGLKIGVARLVAGGVDLGFAKKTGIDLPEERRPTFPDGVQYFNEKYGPRGWTQAVGMNLAIGQGENSQTVLNMARFYTALATDGSEATPEVARKNPERTRVLSLSADQLLQLRMALEGVVAAGGTAASASLSGQGVQLAGKTGTAQTGVRKGLTEQNHAWFVGFAPANDPKIVVAVMLEFGGHGTRAARIASAIIGHYLKTTPVSVILTDG